MSKLAQQIIRDNKAKHARGEDATVLDLGNCDLKELPAEALECVWVEALILSAEWYEYHFENRKREQQRTQNEGKANKINALPPILPQLRLLKKLVIASMPIADLAPLVNLTNLQQLYCSSTQVADLAPFANLTNLQILYCDSTQVADLAPLANLTNLQILYCDSTQVADLAPLANLTNLQQLYCSSTQVADLASLANLTNLQILSCSSTQVADLAPIANLKNLQQLDCASTQVVDLTPLATLANLQQFGCSYTQVVDLTPIASLTNLESLYCASTLVVDLAPISNLTNLNLIECSSTKVVDLAPLANLVNLQILSCSSTRVADLTPLANLTNLQILNCTSTQVTDLAPILFFIKEGISVKWQILGEHFDEDKTTWQQRHAILVKNCPLTNPPVEIVQQGNEAILRYFEEKERLEKDHGTQNTRIKVREAKVLLVGQGKSGKTSLRYKLENPDAPMPAPGDTTRGIEITRLDERMPHTGEPLRLNIWDFGGQDVQHYAHQFFLTGSSLYALVTNERIQDSVHLPYWLNIIEMLGKKSPVILIQNKDGGHCQSLKDEAAIRARFANVHNRVFQSDFSQAKTEAEFAALRKKIVELASELPHIERDYLLSFNQLREKLEAEAREEHHYLRWEEYLKLMPELGEDLMRDYANALTFLGVCQYFPEDALLSEYVFLRPKWLIDALFELLLHPSLDHTRGLFSENATRQIWKGDAYRGMHGLLVRMMKEFELCYRVEGEGENYIIPQRLPGENKTYGWNPKGDIPVQFKYKFMPKGILTRLICRLHPRIENDPGLGQRVWNDAVIFTLPDGRGRVFAREVYGDNTIELRATGAKHDELLNEVIRKMDDINRDTKYDNLQVEKLVPCPCAECASAETPGFHEFEALQRRIEKGKTTSECKKSGEDVPIEEIFGKSGVKKPIVHRTGRFMEDAMGRGSGRSGFEMPVQELQTVKIFLASSSELRDDRDAFDLYFRQQNDQLIEDKGLYLKIVRWENFLDAMSDTRLQAEYNRAVRDCDIFVSLFFTKTGKYTEEEFDVAHGQFQSTGKPKIYTFFKNAPHNTGDIGDEIVTLLHFKKKLKALGHYHTEYKNIEDLKLRFRDQLDQLT